MSGDGFDATLLATVGPTAFAKEGDESAGVGGAVRACTGTSTSASRGAVGTWSVDALAVRLTALEHFGVLKRTAGRPSSYAFASDVVREGLYSTLPFAKREAIHSAIANTLWSGLLRAQSGSFEEARAYACLGSHLVKAGKRAEGRSCLERASQVASGLGDTEWSERLATKAAHV